MEETRLMNSRDMENLTLSDVETFLFVFYLSVNSLLFTYKKDAEMVRRIETIEDAEQFTEEVFRILTSDKVPDSEKRKLKETLEKLGVEIERYIDKYGLYSR
jgi:hypothetical protein